MTRAAFGSRSNQSVTVDSKFWTDGSGNPVYAKKGDTDAGGKPELWVMVIEKAWAKLKEILRRTVTLTREAFDGAVVAAMDQISDDDIRAWTEHCGYAV